MTLSSKLKRPEKSVTEEQTLFVNDPDWQEHWQGMPEFVQEDKKPYHTINLHFQTEEDLKRFQELTGRPATTRTKSFWFADGKWINSKCSQRNVKDFIYENES